MGEPKSEPQGLKPCQFESLYGTTEVVPFPNPCRSELVALAEN